MVPRLVATDLDGTLLNSAGTVSARSREVLLELDARGVPVVFTTGRPIRWMADLWADVGGHGLAICSNGGIVYDVTQRAVRHFTAVPREVGLEVADRVRRALPGTTFAVEHTRGWASEDDFPRHPDDRGGRVSGDLAGVYADDVVKLLALHPEMPPEEFWGEVRELVGDLVTTTWSSRFALVEMSAAGVTKASTLAELTGELDVRAADVVAFGDMPNDVPMLEWAGQSYAMANAHASVLTAARHRAPGNDDDGVAAVLTDLFGLRR